MAANAAYKKVVTIGGTAVPFDKSNISRPRQAINATSTQEAQGTGFETAIAGIHDWSVKISGPFSSSNAGILALEAGFLAGTDVAMAYYPNGTTGQTGNGLVESLSFAGDIKGVETWDATIQADGPLTGV